MVKNNLLTGLGPQSINQSITFAILQVQQTIKVLRILFDHQMNWNAQMEQVVKKATKMASRSRIIRGPLIQDQFL